MTFYRKHARVITPVGEASMTQQHFKDECDINRILAKYEKTGLLTHVSRYGGRYEDLPSDIDYQKSLHVMMEAEEAFMSLPSNVRRRFDNDPEAFLRFVGDPANENEIIEMGLATPKSAPKAPSQGVEQPSPSQGDGAQAQ